MKAGKAEPCTAKRPKYVMGTLIFVQGLSLIKMYHSSRDIILCHYINTLFMQLCQSYEIPQV